MTRYFLFLFTLSLLFSIASYAQEPEKNPADNFLTFEVIQEQYVFDHSTVKAVSIHLGNNGLYDGISITLKKTAVADFTNLTKDGIGKHANFVFNNKIVSSIVIKAAMEDGFILTGITREDAETFIRMLNTNKPKMIVNN